MKNFTVKVLNIVAKIPRGKTMTYSQVASAAGSPRAYRAVGTILHRNFHEQRSQLPGIDNNPVPCHRVIRTDGKIGDYALGNKKKEAILLSEGIEIEKGRVAFKKMVKLITRSSAK